MHKISCSVKTHLHCLPSEPQADPKAGSSPASWHFPNPGTFVSLAVSSTTTPSHSNLGPLQHQSRIERIFWVYLKQSYSGKSQYNVVGWFLMQKTFYTRQVFRQHKYGQCSHQVFLARKHHFIHTGTSHLF